MNALSLWLLCWKERRHCVSNFTSVCRAVGRVLVSTAFHLPISYVSHSEALLWIQMWRDPGFVAEGRVPPHRHMSSLVDMPAHTHWAHGSSLPLKRIHVLYRTEMCCLHCPNPHLLFSSCTLAEGLGAGLPDMTAGRERGRTDVPFFPPVLTSLFPSLVGTFSTGSKPTCRLVCVHGVLLKNLDTEPCASGNRTKGRVYLVPGVSSSIPETHAVSISTKCST